MCNERIKGEVEYWVNGFPLCVDCERDIRFYPNLAIHKLLDEVLRLKGRRARKRQG